MDFTHDDEQEALRDAARGLLARTYGDHEHRRRTVAAEPGFDEDLWQRMAQMGLLALPFAEADGGAGAGPLELGIVCQELGRVNAPEPYLAAVVLAGGLVARAGTAEQRATLLGDLGSGERLLAFAHDEPGRGWGPSAERVTAREAGGGWLLDGTKEPVPHGARAEVLVVSAALPGGGTGLFLVDGPAADRTGYPAYDGSRAARVVLDATPARPLGEPGADATAQVAAAQDLARVMAANQALGAMQTALATTTEYLRTRRQFGVTLNHFQALTFRAADLYVSLELTHSLVDWATMVAATGDTDRLADAAARVALQAGRAGRHVGQEAIQLHGGIGMTAEHPIGGYAAHLAALEHLLGDAGHQLTRLSGSVLEHGSLDPLG